MKPNSLIFALAAISAASAAYSANPAGGTGQYTQGNRYITVGVEPDVGAYKDKAAITVVDKSQTGNTLNNKAVSFAKINEKANNFMIKAVGDIVTKDKNGVTVANMYRMSGAWKWIPGMPDHSNLGRISFAQVGNQDVWFGDWADVKAGAAVGTAGTNNTVFYSGTNRTTNLPTSGTAVYAVKGINNHRVKDSAVLTGNLTADFGKKTLNGSMAKSGLTIAVNNAAINTNAASFSGAAKANNTVNGTAKGHFFGDKGAAIAGVADFGKNHGFNTAFGGTKK